MPTFLDPIIQGVSYSEALAEAATIARVDRIMATAVIVLTAISRPNPGGE